MNPEGDSENPDEALPEDQDNDCAQPQDILRTKTEDLDE